MYQTMSYESQLEMKAHQVKDLLDTAICAGGQKKENGEPDYLLEGIKGSPGSLLTATRWSFLLVTPVRKGRSLWDFTKKEVRMMWWIPGIAVWCIRI